MTRMVVLHTPCPAQDVGFRLVQFTYCEGLLCPVGRGILIKEYIVRLG